MGSTKSELYKYVRWLREQLNVNYDSYPISTVGICNQIDDVEIKYHDFNTNGFCGAVLIGNRSNTVILNSNRSDLEQNFDCGHELVHMTKHRNKGMDCFSCMELRVKRQPNVSFYEWEANEGSAEFLVPYELLFPEIKKALPTLNVSSDYRRLKRAMSDKFKVTDAVIHYRFDSLRYEIQQYLNGTDINDLAFLSNKQQKESAIKVKSLNDVENDLFRKEYHVFFRDTSNLDIAK